ncbi:hypothetical protein [Pokkaliibacter plantistimulans]|uniref:hypothetical protein n=1 Tax=Pokkaliibacter plantistimulans TaxID=1635171 RepID=UPI001A9C9B9A|nr:hypothetical protein [Pokkaliibacter plantistimulans]
MHQFPNKKAVLRALIEYQVEHFQAFYGTQLAAARQSSSSPVLASRNATAREATDPDLALLRWSTARGLSLSVTLGICPLSEDERNRLFERLLDDGAWQGTSAE